MRSVSSAMAVSRITGISVASRRWRHSDSPSSPGIMMSSTTRSIAPHSAARGRGALGRRDPQAVLGEIAREQLADIAVVVDDEDVGVFHGRYRKLSKVKVNASALVARPGNCIKPCQTGALATFADIFAWN